MILFCGLACVCALLCHLWWFTLFGLIPHSSACGNIRHLFTPAKKKLCSLKRRQNSYCYTLMGLLYLLHIFHYSNGNECWNKITQSEISFNCAHLERHSNMLCPHFNTSSGFPSSKVLWRSSAASSTKYSFHLSFITGKTNKNKGVNNLKKQMIKNARVRAAYHPCRHLLMCFWRSYHTMLEDPCGHWAGGFHSLLYKRLQMPFLFCSSNAVLSAGGKPPFCSWHQYGLPSITSMHKNTHKDMHIQTHNVDEINEFSSCCMYHQRGLLWFKIPK